MPRARTLVLVLLAVVVAVRASAAQPLGGTLARIAGDPAAAFEAATTPWTMVGGLGDASAQAIRELPLSVLVWLAERLGLSDSVLQTGWRVLVLVLAVLGALRLARVTGGRPGAGKRTDGEEAPWAPWVAAGLYGLGPVVVATTVGSPSDGLVAALLPWVVTPMLLPEQGWRTAASSAAWLGLAGVGSPHWAVGAFVVGCAAALPLARHHVAQLGRWFLLACLAAAWWVVVLVWEATRATAVTDLTAPPGSVQGLREALGAATWPLWWLVLAASAPVLVAAVSTTLGLRAPGRLTSLLLLAATAGAGLALAAGWRVPVLAPAAGDSTPAPLAPVLAWAALAGLLCWVPAATSVGGLVRRGADSGRRRRVTVSALAGLAAGASALGFLLAVREPPTVPSPDQGLWAQVAEWSATAEDGRVLVLPAVEEERLDPAISRALAGRAWVGRDSLPRSGAAATTAVDDVVQRLSRGLAGPGTTSALARLGVSFVLLRNDVPMHLDRERPAGLVRHALAAQGAERVAVLSSPDSADPDGAAAPVTDRGLRAEPTVEIWSVEDGSPARLYPAQPFRVAGTAEVISDLADAGLAGAAPVTLVGPGEKPTPVMSDSARRRDVDQRRALDPYGPLLTEGERRALVPPGAAGEPAAARRLLGVVSVAASSTAADLDGVRRRAGSDAATALDGNAYTAWQSRSGTGLGEWWQVEFEGPTDLTSASARVALDAFDAQRVTAVTLESERGETEVDVQADGLVSLAPAGTTTWLRIVATAVEGEPTTRSRFALTELSVPGLAVQDQLVVSGPATSWILAARPGSHATCVPAVPRAAQESAVGPGIATACAGGLSVPGSEAGTLARVVEVSRPTPVTGRVWLRASPTDTTARRADTLAEPTVVATASSVATTDLTTRAQAAADADRSTAWRPATSDEAPRLSLSWAQPSQVSGIRLRAADGPASAVTRVRVQPAEVGVSAVAPAVERVVGEDGLVRFPPVRAAGLTLTILEDSEVPSLDSATGLTTPLPVAVAEVDVLGGPEVRYAADTPHDLPCGEGPVVTLGGERVESTLTVTPRQLVEASVVRARLCGRPVLDQGEATVHAAASLSWAPAGVVLAAPDGPLGAVDEHQVPAAPAVTALDVEPLSEWVEGQVVKLATPPSGQGTLALAVPAGKGWTARSGSTSLEPVTVDGWAQGWRVPPGARQVRVDYSPAGALRTGVVLSAIGWVVTVAVALVGRGRTSRRDQAIAGRSTQA